MDNKTNEFVQFSISDGYWWVWRKIVDQNKSIWYRKIRLATDEEIAGEIPKKTSFEQ